MSDTPVPADENAQLTHDTVFSMLSNRRRRLAIYYLTGRDEPARVREMATQLAVWENGLPESKLNYQQRKRVYTSLHQTHLPKLDESGFVEYDRDRKTVALTPRAETLRTYLEPVDGRDVAWERVYLGIAAAGGLSVLLAWVGVPLFSQVPGLTYAGVLAVLLAAVATVHGQRSRRAHSAHAAGRLASDAPQPVGSADERD
jgi:hypothetical protein